ncbi:MAG: ferredoxin reductase family protein [Candidatus Komeilibacteria bacterium]
MKKSITIIITILFITIVLWVITPTAVPRFVNFNSALANLGQIFGLLGVVLFAINLILSARLPWIEKIFRGLNNVYLRHGQLGQIALILLLLHPLLLIPKYATDIPGAAQFLTLGSNWAINWGIVSLGLMMILIVLTLYLRPKYNFWKYTHKFLGFSFFLASIHIWFIPSDVSHFLPLRVWVIAMMILGTLAFVYQSIFRGMKKNKHYYTVSKVHSHGDQITEIKLTPQGKKMSFVSGQFAFLKFADQNLTKESHPFSMTSSPKDQTLTFLVKSLGDFTEKIKQVPLHTKVEVEGPYGHFTLKNASNKHQIWIAGGIGITPFISMAQSLVGHNDYNIKLFYCVRNKTEACHVDLLQSIAASSHNNFQVIPFCSNQQGRLSIGKIDKMVDSLKDRDILICAPPPMITDLKKQLHNYGFNKANIYSEEFSF